MRQSLNSLPGWRPSFPSQSKMQEIFPYLTPKVRSDLIRWSLHGDFTDVNVLMIKHHNIEIPGDDLILIAGMLGIPVPGIPPEDYEALLQRLEYSVKRAKKWRNSKQAAVRKAVAEAVKKRASKVEVIQ